MRWLHVASRETSHVPEQAVVFCCKAVAGAAIPQPASALPSLPHFPFPHSYFPRTELPHRVPYIRCCLRLLSKKHPTGRARRSVLHYAPCRLAAGIPFLGSSHLLPKLVGANFSHFTQGNVKPSEYWFKHTAIRMVTVLSPPKQSGISIPQGDYT